MLKKIAPVFLLLTELWLGTKAARAQSDGCPAVAAHEPAPSDPVRQLLKEGRIADAATQANRFVADTPHAAAALTALAEVQLRKGQPWLAALTLDNALQADHCYARIHLIRSRIFRLDSMYASERRELQTAYEMDPDDPDIHRAWTHTVNPANDIQRIQESLATMTDLDPGIRERAQASANSMMSLLSENSQTCQSSPITGPMTLPLLPSYENVKQTSGYKLEVQFPKSKSRLVVDTAASGLYISRALADSNGLQHAGSDPANTVRVENVRIGTLEFRNCMVGVSDAAFTSDVEGYIGSDVFSPYLVALDFPRAKLELAPLPAIPVSQESTLPGDRYAGPDLRGYAPVYHKNQYLLVPVMLNQKDRRLFVLDTGIRLSTMSTEVAHSISSTRVNFTNPIKTVSGSTLHIYRDSFNLQFANLSLDHQDHILEFDPSAVEQNAGMEVAGLLGFDILHGLVLRIDYRDGLVQFESATPGLPQKGVSPGTMASTSAPNVGGDTTCNAYAGQDADRPLSTAIRGSVIGWLDSGHLTQGQAIRVKVTADWIAQSCSLFAGTTLYGHVLAAKATKGASALAVAFDQGDCSGHPRQPLTLRVVGLRDATAVAAVHSVIPTEVAGGARAISSTAASLGNASDDDMKAGSTMFHPGTVNGIPHLKLVPDGGPQCSALMTSEERSVHLGTGTEFILTMQATP